MRKADVAYVLHLVDPGDAGVVDEHVDMAVLGQHVVHQGIHGCFGPQVRLEGVTPDAVCDALRLLLGAVVMDDDFISFGCELLGAGGANAPGCAGHQCDFCHGKPPISLKSYHLKDILKL